MWKWREIIIFFYTRFMAVSREIFFFVSGESKRASNVKRHQFYGAMNFYLHFMAMNWRRKYVNFIFLLKSLGLKRN